MNQFLAFGSAVFFGFGDFTGGVVARRLPVWTVVVWSHVLGLGVLVLGLVVVRSESVTLRDLVFGGIAGLVGVVGLAVLYTALATGTMSMVAPISGAVAATLPVVTDLATGGTLSSPEKLGVAGAILAVLLIGGGDRVSRAEPHVLIRAVGAGLAFGVFFIAFAQTSADAGLWPLVSARAVTIPVAMLMAVLAGGATHAVRPQLPLLAVAGTLDMTANVAIALALQRGPLGVNAVLSSLYPAFTAIAAVALLHERPTRRQALGIAMALAAATALAL